MNNKITYSVLYGWLKQENLIKRKKRYQKRVHHMHTRLPAEGLLLQLDGSHHKWNGKDEWVLIAAIDEATSKIAHAEFYTSEDKLNCLNLLEHIINKFIIPEGIYVDNAGWFGGTKRDGFSHFVNACETLGIRIIFANTSQAKGRIECAWNTFQDRHIPEMRLYGIKNIVKAKEYLHDVFVQQYWNKNNIVPKEILFLKETSLVKNENTISWDAETYKITFPNDISIAKRHIEIRTVNS